MINSTPWELSKEGRVIITPLLQQKLRDGKFISLSLKDITANTDGDNQSLIEEVRNQNKALREELLLHIYNGNIEYSNVPLNQQYGWIVGSKLISASNRTLFYETKASNSSATNRILLTANRLEHCFYILLDPDTGLYRPEPFVNLDEYNTHITVGIEIHNDNDKRELQDRCKNSFSMVFLIDGCVSSFRDLSLSNGTNSPSIIYRGIPVFSLGVNNPISVPDTAISLQGEELTKALSRETINRAHQANLARVPSQPKDISWAEHNLPNIGLEELENIAKEINALPSGSTEVIELKPKPFKVEDVKAEDDIPLE